ncbi:MAG: DNA methyltransferase, partial [bacterium]
MHKYWARKPHNVVSRYIEYYTNEGDTVLDPFMGSG